MNNKRILTISILSMFTVIILTVAIILFSVNKREKMLTENMIMIKSNYANFSANISDNLEIRTELTNKITEFKAETYEEERGNFSDILNKYDKNIRYVDALVKDMESRCKYNYEDTTVKLLCRGYDALYEETINNYISSINAYNEKITKYNETAETKQELHTLIHKEYIDYDKDGEYEGK